MHIDIPNFMVVEENHRNQQDVQRNVDEVDILSKFLSCFSFAGVICIIVLLWMQTFVGLQQSHLIAYDAKKEVVLFIRNQIALFGPRINSKGIGGVLYTSSPDIYGCILDNITTAPRFNDTSTQDANNQGPIPQESSSQQVTRTLLMKAGETETAVEYFTGHIDNDRHQGWRHTPLLLVRRAGGCSFVQKASNAEEKGYLGIVVFDNVDQVIDSSGEARLIVMGPEIKKKQSHIHIPAVFVSKENGGRLYHLIEPNKAPHWLQRAKPIEYRHIFPSWRSGIGEAFYLHKSPVPSLTSSGGVFRNSEISRRLEEDIPSKDDGDKAENEDDVHALKGLPILIEPGNKSGTVALTMISGFAFMLTVCGFTLACISFISRCIFDDPLFSFRPFREADRERRRRRRNGERYFGPRSRNGDGVLSQTEILSLDTFAYQKEEELSGGVEHRTKGSGSHGSDLSSGTCSDVGCSICLDSFKVQDRVTKLPCGHSFHASCVGEWLSRWNGTCPLCKQKALPETLVKNNSPSGLISYQHRNFPESAFLMRNTRPQPSFPPNDDNDELTRIVQQIEEQEEVERLQGDMLRPFIRVAAEHTPLLQTTPPARHPANQSSYGSNQRS